MPFMKGPAPVRRTLQYLNSSRLYLKPWVRVLSLNYNIKGENHAGAKSFAFWHLAQIQYKNPEVQVITFKNLTPTPFIRAFLNNGKEILMDIDRQSKDEIVDRVLNTLCKTQQELDADRAFIDIQSNPAHFGYGCSRHCICEIPGQVPCPAVVPLPYTWRGKYAKGHAELDETKFV
ncbi:unnamed protein product [Allacma fusca]|uniref:Small ribosomal subunit protein mS25 n=1 Tax=Allacma fusca TaxID=39272 RepID=A0A8J2NKX7_9HEXA|nr:unnamed protein product [Allacma fusca]